MISDSRRWTSLFSLLRIWTCGWIALLSLPAAAAAFDAAAVFTLKCSGCHSVGNGDLVGPDLRGVSARRDARWLRSFIRSSQSLIRHGDRTAVALFQKYKKRMPDHDFTDQEIEALLAFIAAGGPKQEAGGYRHARTATPADVARGRSLFTGTVALAGGGAACIRCHSAGNAVSWRSGTLASDLTEVYLKYRDGGLARALTQSRFPLMAEYRDRPLTREETFAIKAFLYQAARSSPAAGRLAQNGSTLGK